MSLRSVLYFAFTPVRLLVLGVRQIQVRPALYTAAIYLSLITVIGAMIYTPKPIIAWVIGAFIVACMGFSVFCCYNAAVISCKMSDEKRKSK